MNCLCGLIIVNRLLFSIQRAADFSSFRHDDLSVLIDHCEMLSLHHLKKGRHFYGVWIDNCESFSVQHPKSELSVRIDHCELSSSASKEWHTFLASDVVLMKDCETCVWIDHRNYLLFRIRRVADLSSFRLFPLENSIDICLCVVMSYYLLLCNHYVLSVWS